MNLNSWLQQMAARRFAVLGTRGLWDATHVCEGPDGVLETGGFWDGHLAIWTSR